MVEKYQNFLKIIKDLKPYLIKFEENQFMKTKNYLNNYIISKNIC